FRELSVVGDQYWCHVIVQTSGFATVDAPAPVAAERTPGQRSLNVGAVVAKLELPDCAELVEPDKEIEVLVGEPATVRLTRRLRRFTPRRENARYLGECRRRFTAGVHRACARSARRDDYFAQHAICAHALNSIAQSTGGFVGGPALTRSWGSADSDTPGRSAAARQEAAAPRSGPVGGYRPKTRKRPVTRTIASSAAAPTMSESGGMLVMPLDNSKNCAG